MSSKMLIDASRPEETRVVVVRGNRIEEYDYESKDRKQLRGNIYLAQVTRVEPSLQAAFVEYGGNRQGFLAFSEIHPDYYQIPVADREALLAEEAAQHVGDDEDDDEDDGKSRGGGRGKRRARRGRRSSPKGGATERVTSDSRSADATRLPDAEPVGWDEDALTVFHDEADRSQDSDDDDANQDGDDADGVSEDQVVESVGEEDSLEEVTQRRRTPRKNYKIQEVIKRRQIMLIQVVKEERGNKGAALTTYLSLAGRYSVLMPNTARGGGISRKITQATDRQRLKSIVGELEVPKGMGVILRTAGANRTRIEIKRDFDYLMRLWSNVRDLTLSSKAPALVYEEGNLIKRSIRDLYNKDISDVVVSGENGYKEAKAFMRMLMPSHAKAVQQHTDPVPIFSRNGIDGQLNKMLEPQVSLKSGGYLVINQTEALVAIDVNSGRSTKEHSIEDTALQTNLEAAEEVARQLRLRDLAGLIVIDFIDMMENRNNRAVERKLKDCLKNDRARIQVGRISPFGLLEMSRQRIRTSVLESAMQPCPHCHGTGWVRSANSFALHVIRAIEEHLLRDPRHHVTVRLSPHAAMDVLNLQRRVIVDLENQYHISITVVSDPALAHDDFTVSRGDPADNETVLQERSRMLAEAAERARKDAEIEDDEIVDEEEDDDADSDDEKPSVADNADAEGEARPGRSKRRRRRRGRNGNGRNAEANGADPKSDDDEDDDESDGARATSGGRDDDGDSDREDSGNRRRRRGRRGGRRRKGGRDERPRTPAAEPIGFSEEELAAFAAEDREKRNANRPDRAQRDEDRTVDASDDAGEPVASDSGDGPQMEEVVARSDAKPASPVAVTQDTVSAAPEPVATEPDPAAEAPTPRRRSDVIATEPVVTSATANGAAAEEKPTEAAPTKKGWWQRRGFL